MSISNPCSWFAGGSGFDDKKSFTYEGGKNLYHFSSAGKKPNKTDSGWTGNLVAVNVIFFADSEEHARDVFRRMLEFRMEAAILNSSYYKENEEGRVHARDFLERNDWAYNTCKLWLSKLDKAVFSLAPTNQFFKVGWADNDVILR